MTSSKKRGSLPTVCSKDSLMHAVNWPVWAHSCPSSSLGPGQDVWRLCAKIFAEILCVLWEKNPKTQKSTVMDKYSSGIQEKCKDASQVSFHLLVMIPSSVTGSKTQAANSSLLPAMPEQSRKPVSQPGLCYQADCLPDWWTSLWAGTVPGLWLCR